MSSSKIGVIGAGSFGTTVANLIAQNADVILYARNQEVVDTIKATRELHGYQYRKNIQPTSSLEQIAGECEIIFPVISSSGFRDLMKSLSPYVHPYHMLIHGTKGLDVSLPEGKTIDDPDVVISRSNVKTMSEVIRDETSVVRIGGLAGPNLAREIADEQPAATVVASAFDTVILEGQRLLRNDQFQVYGNKDLIGIELTGVLKNIIAIAAGVLSGLGYGENTRSLLISRGMVEMIHLGKALGGNTEAFIGLAGIGDLVATCSSKLSRNYTVGYRLAKEERIADIISSMDEVAEGVNTVKIVKKFAEHYKFRAPITEIVYKIIFEGLSVKDAQNYLMKIPQNVDINFM